MVPPYGGRFADQPAAPFFRNSEKHEFTLKNDMKELSGVKVHCAFEKAVDVVDLVEHPRNPNKHGLY